MRKTPLALRLQTSRRANAGHRLDGEVTDLKLDGPHDIKGKGEVIDLKRS